MFAKLVYDNKDVAIEVLKDTRKRIVSKEDVFVCVAFYRSQGMYYKDRPYELKQRIAVSIARTVNKSLDGQSYISGWLEASKHVPAGYFHCGPGEKNYKIWQTRMRELREYRLRWIDSMIEEIENAR